MATTSRSVVCVILLIAAFSGVSISDSFAQTVTFDNLPTADNEITSSYEGYTWTNFGSLSPSYYGYNNGFSNGLVSGTNVGFSWDANQTSTITAGNPFSLTDSYFTGAWSEKNSVTVVGYVNGVDTYSTTFTETPTAPSHEVFNWSDLSQVTFLASGGGQFVVDNLTLNPTSTPEASPLIAISIGLCMLAGFAFNNSLPSARISQQLNPVS
jgi:hypothetical protein